MLQKLSPLVLHRQALANGSLSAEDVARETIANANGNASRNTYIHFDPSELMETSRLLDSQPLPKNAPLFAVPISLKDCFDLIGTRTSCGSKFYAEANAPAVTYSGIAQRVRSAGALLTGKTHLHPLAYGITGQNPDYGDCLQPRDPSLLTGGSSSGAAASVQEQSALAAIGTDTGGSIRVPAALCGLVGYRASHSLAARTGWFPNAWSGAGPLSPSFDTIGFLLRDPRDAAPIAQALFHLPAGVAPATLRIGCPAPAFLTDSSSDVLAGLEAWKQYLAGFGAEIAEFDAAFWAGTLDIFAKIQAHEAAAIHHGNFHHFEASIRERLAWGASFTTEDIEASRVQLQYFRADMRDLFKRFDLLLLPAAPVSRLEANADLSSTRKVILRYTTPFSVAGLPALSLPGELIGAPFGTGIQIAAAPDADPMLLAFAANIARPLVA